MLAMDAIVRLFVRLFALTGLIAIGAAVTAVYSMGRNQVVEGIYREKLSEVVEAHEKLRTRYESAMKKTIVTEIEVKGGEVNLLVRSVEGVVKRIPTDLDPRDEVFVDYLVIDDRLLIRRVYGDKTPPAEGVAIDPELVDVDWDDESIQRGQSIYRGKLTEGRWLVTMTGNGALDLTKAEGETPPLVAGPPTIKKFEEVTDEINAEVETVKTTEVIEKLQEKYITSNP